MDDMTPIDIEVTETEIGAKMPTGSIRRFYTINGDIVAREAGSEVRFMSVEEIPDGWKVEGAINALIKGKISIEDILSGKAIPNRAPPAEKVAKGPRPGKVSMLTMAIADLKAIVLTKEAKAAGESRPSKDKIAAQALAWASSLSKDEKNEYAATEVVQARIASLKGVKVSIDALFGSGSNKEEDDAA